MRTLNIIFGAILLVLMAAVMYIFYMGITTQPKQSNSEPNADSSQLTTPETVSIEPSLARFMDGAESLKTDFDTAVLKLANLASDISADPFYRTSAANILAQSLMYTQKEVVADALTANEEASQHVATAADTQEAQRRLYEWSNSIDTNPVAQLGELKWYMHELQNNAQLQATERNAYIDTIDTALKEVEALFQSQSQEDGRKSLLDALIYHALRGDVYAFRYTQDNNVLDKERAVDAYERALRIDPVTGHGLWARYHLANFLRKSEGESARERVEALLDGVIATYAINPTITLFTVLETEKDATTVAHTDAVETAQFYGPFAEVLRELGWTIPDPA